jgi:hypothetical protein
MDYMLDPPEDDELPECGEEGYDGADDWYDEEEAAANASSNWQNSRNM